MLQDIRKNIKGTAAKIVVGLIVVSFAIFGIESILLGGGGGGVAEVNGEEISPQELQQAVNTQKRRLIAMMGDELDPSMIDDELLGRAALQDLIGRKLLKQTAEEMDLAVSEQEIGRVIGSMEQFQLEGKFSPQLYTSVLSSAGYTPGFFKQTLREDIALNQMRAGLAGSEFATPLELDLNARIAAEQRDLRYMTIPLEEFLAGDPVAEQDIQAYYQANQEDFRTEESAELDYIELSVDDFREPVDEDALREAYELELQNAQYQPQSRVSHILFIQREGESGEALQERIAAAREKLAAGADFGEVAGEFSDDVGSAASGGDLGYTTGDTFPAEMEEAIAALAPDAVSEPVQTEAGIHLIKVTERREGSPPTLEEMRPQLEDQLQLAEARVELLRTVEQLRDRVFNAEDLEGPAAEIGLVVKRSEPVTRNQSDGLFANPSLLSAVFSEEVRDDGHNSDVIELGGDRFVVLRHHRLNLPEILGLDEVRDRIAAILAENAAREKVATRAAEAVQRLRSGASMEELAGDWGYQWQVELAADRSNMVVPPDVLEHVFSLPAPPEGETVVDQLLTPGGDARVIALARVNPGSFEALEPPARRELRRQVSGEYARLLNDEFQSGLRGNADISVM